MYSVSLISVFLLLCRFALFLHLHVLPTGLQNSISIHLLKILHKREFFPDYLRGSDGSIECIILIQDHAHAVLFKCMSFQKRSFVQGFPLPARYLTLTLSQTNCIIERCGKWFMKESHAYRLCPRLTR